MTAPISCIITSYNNGPSLHAAVESVLRQTLPVTEILIADDGSTDGSREEIASLAKKHPKITPILRQSNLGVAANRDLAIRAASQPFVTHLDGDDLFAPNKIAAEWHVLAGRTNAVAYSLITRIWPGKWWRSRVLDPAETVGDPDKALDRLLARAGAIPRDMLLSKALFEQAGGFSHSVRMYEDWQFKLRLAGTGVQWICSNALGTIYIKRSGSLSSASAESHKYWRRHVMKSITNSEVELGTNAKTEREEPYRISLGDRLLAQLRLFEGLYYHAAICGFDYAKRPG